MIPTTEHALDIVAAVVELRAAERDLKTHEASGAYRAARLARTQWTDAKQRLDALVLPLES